MVAHNRINYKENELINGVKFIKDTKTVNKRRFAEFECKCGNSFETRISDVKNGKTRSCGCIIIPLRIKNATKHNMFGHPIYNLWCRIKDRCYNKNSASYERYGGRGITMFEVWAEDFQSFYDYVSVIEGYKDGFTLDRIDNNKGYFPINLRWADRHTQTANRRKFNNCKSGFKGVYFKDGKYYTDISVNGKRIYIGRFNTETEAAEARNNYIIEHGLWEYPVQNTLVA